MHTDEEARGFLVEYMEQATEAEKADMARKLLRELERDRRLMQRFPPPPPMTFEPDIVERGDE